MTMILFVSAIGFVGSAVIAYSGGLLTGTSGGYQLSFHSLSAIIVGFFVCMFAGPFITAQHGLTYWRDGFISAKELCFAFSVSLVWSFCAGVVFVILMAQLGFVAI